MTSLYFISLVALMAFAILAARSRAASIAGGKFADMHSLPSYHGMLAATAVLIPMLLVYLIGQSLLTMAVQQNVLAVFPDTIKADDLQRGAALRDAANLANGAYVGEPTEMLRKAADAYSATTGWGAWAIFIAGLTAGTVMLVACLSRISMTFRARNLFERIVLIALMMAAGVAVLTTIGIVFSVLYETLRFFFDPALKGRPTVSQFLFGTEWNPQAALRADQGDIKSAFGFVPLLTGTLLITVIAMTVAGPLGLFSAIYLSEYASSRTRAYAKPILEVLAGIPTVVLGFFAALTVAPLIRGWGASVGLDIASESALAAGLVMGMMIIPFVSSLSDDVINAVPQSLRDGSYALGATKSETIQKVVLPAALPGIVSAFMLAISRAIGETMIVVMAAGLAANLTLNPLDAVTTVTVQIKTILVGDQEFDSAKTLAAFALGFVLFFITLMLNIIALRIVRKYREAYD
jgi:phosphate transport system permease protein